MAGGIARPVKVSTSSPVKPSKTSSVALAECGSPAYCASGRASWAELGECTGVGVGDGKQGAEGVRKGRVRRGRRYPDGQGELRLAIIARIRGRRHDCRNGWDRQRAQGLVMCCQAAAV